MAAQTFGILAFPAGHSLSPAMQTAAFDELGIDAKYQTFEIPPEKLEDFIQKVRSEKIAGLSVSIPHKVEIMPLLDEVSPSARKIGAVNTVFWKDKKLVGENTDRLGAVVALQAKVATTEKPTLADKKVVLLGGGGAARAVVSGLLEEGAEVVVITREPWESAGIQKDFGVRCDLILNLEKYSPDILINATPLGMAGELVEQSFVQSAFFEKCRPLVFDLVYNPAETRLLREARAAGCQTLAGLEMFVWQGASQFKIWTNKDAPITVMRAAAEKALNL